MEKGLISVDRWTEGSQVYFLTHLHSDHTHGLSSSWAKGPLFCSRLTAKLFGFKFPDFNLSLIRILDIGSWHSLSLVSPSIGSQTTVQVMAIDAHHCPGAVMLLFRGEFGCLLYTGDFRWEATSERANRGRDMLCNAIKDEAVDIVYLDNTYCNPSYTFPTRQIAAQQIWVWPERLQTMHLLGFHDNFTTNTSLTRVRAVPRYSFSTETLEGLNTMRPTIGIMPSGLPWVKHLQRDDNLFDSLLTRYNRRKMSTNGEVRTDQPDGKSRYVEKLHEYIYSVPYSDHSSFLEIEDFVKIVQPTNLKGIVSASTCYIEPMYYFGCLCGANQPAQRLHYKHKRKGRGRVAAGQTKSSFGSGNSAKYERKRGSIVKIKFLGGHVSRVTALRRMQHGAKILENESPENSC